MDKELEREILKMVYTEDQFAKIIDGESPDFKLFHNASSAPFGVEITEFHFDESNARLKKINSYRKELIDEEKYRHKDDIDIFDVGELKIFDSDGSIKFKQKVLTRKSHTIEAYINLITDAIKNKSDSIEEYKKGLDHVNLIIFDQDHKLFSTKSEEFFKYFYRPSIREILLKTGFREIFLITIIEENRRVFFPLKMLLYIAEFYFFGNFLEKRGKELQISSLNDQIRLFAELMRNRGLETYILNNYDGIDEVICGNYGITVKEDKKVLVIDYADKPTSVAKQVPDYEKNKSIINSAFIRAFNNYSGNCNFTSGIVLDVKNSLN